MTQEEISRSLEVFFLAMKHNAQWHEIPQDVNLFEQGIVTSLTFVELVVFIEKTFKVVLDDDVIFSNRFNTLDSITRYVHERINH